MRQFSWILLVAQQAYAHTGFTNLFVNGVDQGDAVAIRMNKNPTTFNYPINHPDTDDFACGFNGTQGVGRVAPVPDGATLTLRWREHAADANSTVIDPSHMGPCSVFLKKVSSAVQDTAAGDGWFKIWDQGYDQSANQWCTTKLINNGGYITVDLPKGLQGGYYLLRGSVVALHVAAPPINNPQYYAGCAQIFVNSTGNLVPSSTVAIPGIAKIGDAADSYNIFATPLSLPYPVPGGPVVALQAATGSSAVAQTQQTEGLKPGNCICEAGSDFCGVEVQDYTDTGGCWQSSIDCTDQLMACFNAVTASAANQCNVWAAHCADIGQTCANHGSGPPNKGKDYTVPKSTISVPAPLGPTTTATAASAAATTAASQHGNAAANAEQTVTTTVLVTVAKREPTPVPAADRNARRDVNYQRFKA